MRIVLKAPKRTHQSTHDVYSSCQKAPKKGRVSQTEPNQLMKLTIDINLSPINSLVQVTQKQEFQPSDIEFHILKRSSVSLF